MLVEGDAPLLGKCEGCKALIFEGEPHMEWAGCIYVCEECDAGQHELITS